jgi:hypothetical protein
MDPVRQAPKGTPINWANLNPFNKAERRAAGAGDEPQPQPKERTDVSDDPNNLDPAKKINSKGGEGHDPMLEFESLWQPNVDKDGKPVVENKASGSYIPQMDGKKLSEMVSKMDFTKDFTPEEVEAFNGQDANTRTAAFGSMMNKVARRAFSSALAASTKLNEAGFNTARERFMGEVPDHVREMMTENELSGSVSVMKNPAFAPMVNMIKKQYLAKFPKATPGEVNKAVTQYFDAFGAELTKKPAGPGNVNSAQKKLRQGSPDADFMDWISAEVGPAGMFQDGGNEGEESQQ